MSFIALHQHGAHCEQTCVSPYVYPTRVIHALPSWSELARMRVYQRKLLCNRRIQPLEMSEEISVELLCLGLFDVLPQKCVCAWCALVHVVGGAKAIADELHLPI